MKDRILFVAALLAIATYVFAQGTRVEPGNLTVLGSTLTSNAIVSTANSSAVNLSALGRASDNVTRIFFNSHDAGTNYGSIGASATTGGTMQISATGAMAFTSNVPVTNAGRYNSAAAQPGFLAFNSANDDYNSAATTLVDFDTEVYDTAAAFASDTFTAPLTGIYQLCAAVSITHADGAISLLMATSNRSYEFGASGSIGRQAACVFADMDTGDTATVTMVTTNLGVGVSGTVNGSGSPYVTFFSGRLVP